MERYALWSPDGRQIALASFRTGLTDIYLKPTAGTGTERRLVSSDAFATPSSWSPDGRFVRYYTFHPTGGS